MSLPSDHGVIVLSKLLDALDGKTVRINSATRDAASDNDEDFERRVRKAMDRMHRRAVIHNS